MYDSLFSMAIIIGGVFLLLPVGVIYLLVANSKLKERMGLLEFQVKALKKSAQKAETETAAPSVQSQAAATLADPRVAADETAPLETAQPDQEQKKPIKSSAQNTPTWTPPEQRAAKAKASKAELEPAPIEPRTDISARFIGWLTQNWFYVVSAVSLALAGIYFVIYSMEQGLLPPIVRVMMTFAFGGALIAAGEFLRRRYGDEDDKSTAYLPSTFSGAGLVTLFAGVLLARFLYGFIGPELALVGLALIGALAMVFGWFYGPFLAAVGVIGAMVAPFVIGGESDTPEFLYVYFAVVSISGLLIDTLRRWAWVSVLSVALGFLTGGLIALASGWATVPFFTIYCVVLAAAAIVIPVRRLLPDHTGPSFGFAMSETNETHTWPEFPVCLAAGSVLTASIFILLGALDVAQESVFWTAIVALTGMTVGLLLLTRKTNALVDLAALPAVALVVTAAQGAFTWSVPVAAELGQKVSQPLDASLLVGLGLLISAAAAWRSLQGGPAKLFLAGAATLFAPLLAITLEVAWQPALILGAYGWALHALVIGAVMVFFAERFAKVDGPDARERMSLAVLCALACITFALVLIFSSVALTSAIVFTVVAAMWLDRKYDLPWMSAFVLPGIMAVGFRLTVDPGIEWAMKAPWWEMFISHGGAVVGFVAAWVLAKAAKRPRTEVLIETAVVSSFGIFVTLLLGKSVMELSSGLDENGRWMIGLTSTIWFLLGIVQLRRLSLGGRLSIVRKVLAALFIGVAGLQLLSSLTVMNPVFTDWSGEIIGPVILNTLILAYLLPSAALMFGAWWLTDQPKMLRRTLAGVSIGLGVVWLILTIRHFWLGAENMDAPWVDPAELYTYTVALMLIGAGLIYQSIARSSAFLRKAGLIVIGLAVFKVFAWDIRDLGGLTRVFSLLFLGLALAGLAWLNRWAAAQAQGPIDEASDL